MAPYLTKLNLMIAHAIERPWSAGLVRSLAAWPLDLHRSRTDTETISLVASGEMHVAVLDDELPGTGGLEVLRRIRRMGLVLPCLLVCEEPDARFLSEALALDVFSVVQASGEENLLAPLVLKAVRRTYRLDWQVPETMN